MTPTNSLSAEDCLFCRIVSRDINSDIVFEDDEVLAFKDANPQAPVHLLIIPKAHISNVLDLGESNLELMGRLVSVANRLAREEKIDGTGFRLVTNTGPEVGQSVYHLHLHLLGGRSMRWPPG